MVGRAADGSPRVGQRVCIACLTGPGLWLCAGVWPPHPRPLSPVSRGRGGLSVARAFQPEICPLRLAAWRLLLPGRVAGGWPYAKPRGGRTRSVFGVWSGEPRTGVRGWGSVCALHALPVLVCGCVLGCVPLTPDPSPPFHGGEGRNALARTRTRAGAGVRAGARARARVRVRGGGDAKVGLCCGGFWFAKGTFVASL